MLGELPFANISHLGWVVRDINKTIKYFEDLGIGPWHRYTLPSPGHDFIKRERQGKPAEDHKCEVALARWGSIIVELFEPISGHEIQRRFLETKGEGIFHFGYLVEKENYDKAVDEMLKRGFKVIGHSQYKNGVRMAFFDTDKIGGVIFQLHDCPPEIATMLECMGALP